MKNRFVYTFLELLYELNCKRKLFFCVQLLVDIKYFCFKKHTVQCIMLIQS